MKFCQTHWDALKRAIAARGLGDLIAESGDAAATKLQSQAITKRRTLKNFEPLIEAHNTIIAHTIDLLSANQINPMPLLTGIEGQPELECPICYLNYVAKTHDESCTDPNCKQPKGRTFDNWINKAADGMAQYAATLPRE